MAAARALRIGITCYPTVGGSGILAAALGEELARRGHEVHFISYERPFRLPAHAPRLQFHPVTINDYELFKYPDYTLPLSVRMAEVSRDFGLDVLHVHYAVPHATAAILARSMLPRAQQPKVVTTLHGTDTTLLGRDADYAPAIRHALVQSNAVTAVSAWLRDETRRLLDFRKPLEVIPNFFAPRKPRRSRAAVRAELGVDEQALIIHSSNLRPVKRIDLLLEAAARISPRDAFKLLILAGGDFSPFRKKLRQLGLGDRVVVREQVVGIEEYLRAADLSLYTSDSESFCLSVLEGMWFGCPPVSTAVGGVPEVVRADKDGVLLPCGCAEPIAAAISALIADPRRRRRLGRSAQVRARTEFSADAVVPRYEQLYRRVCGIG